MTKWLHLLAALVVGVVAQAGQAAAGENVYRGLAIGAGALEALGKVLEGAPADRAVLEGLRSADSIFSDVNWVRLRGYHRTLNGWRVADQIGRSSVDDIEIVFVNDLRQTAVWCRSLLAPAHPAWGCTKPRPPWRLVSTVTRYCVRTPRGCAFDGVNPSSVQILSHELWHLKGYWGHIRDLTWPAGKDGRPAPVRVPTARD